MHKTPWTVARHSQITWQHRMPLRYAYTSFFAYHAQKWRLSVASIAASTPAMRPNTMALVMELPPPI